MAGEDFVNVQLTKAGIRLAGDGVIRLQSGKYGFVFKPGEPQRIARAFDWEEYLSKQHIDGELLFELVDEQQS